MLAATLLALGSACLHAGWNLIAKRSTDPLSALWGQFAIAGVLSLIALFVVGGVPAEAWAWASITGIVHVPYLLALAAAYDRGDFSLAYPVARGGGALLAGIGGIVLLGDDVGALAVTAIVVVVIGMLLLSYGADRVQVGFALIVAVAIGIYSTVDAHAARDVAGSTYVFCTFVVCGLSMSLYGMATGRAPALVRAVRSRPATFTMTAVMSVTTYGLVMLAVRRAPVGYVAALRESSVLLAAFVGWRYLDEGNARRRLLAAAVIVVGLILLISAG
jgi:drug/metabolite transporter (DMT)-like permease